MSEVQSHPPLWRVHGLMVLAAILVSTSFVVGKAVADGLDPAVLTLIRFLLATLLFAPYVCRRHGLQIPTWRSLRGYAMISAVLVAFFWFMFASLRYTSALNTSAIFTLVPGISGIYGAVLLRERLSVYRLLALVFGMVGALWIIFRGDISLMFALAFNKGDVLFLIGCLAMAFYTPLVKLFYRGEPMAVMTFWVLVTGSGWLLLLSIPRLVAVPWLEVAPFVWAGIAYLAVFSTIITFFLTHFATPLLGSTRVMAYSYFYPGMVLVLDWLLGRGLPPLMTLPGVIIVLLATVVLQRGAVEVQVESIS